MSTPPSPDPRPSDELLPESTGDDHDMVEQTPDDWYQRERPPHHG